METLWWGLVAAGGAGLIALAAVPGLRSQPRSILFWTGLLFAVAAIGAGIFKLATLPRPWANISLHCIRDERIKQNSTQFDGLPRYVVYVTDVGDTVVHSGEQETFDPESGALFQLSTDAFLRCNLENDGPVPLTNVKVALQTVFLPQGLVPGKTYNFDFKSPRSTVAIADLVGAEGGSFNFAVVNFGKTALLVRGNAFSADGFSTPLSNLKSDDVTRFLLNGSLSLLPGAKRANPWHFYEGCNFYVSIPPGVPVAEAQQLMASAVGRFLAHPPVGCSGSSYNAWKKQIQKEYPGAH